MSNEMTTETVQADAQADVCVNVLKMSEVIAAIREEEAEMKGDEA